MTPDPDTKRPIEGPHASGPFRRAAWAWWFFAAIALFYLLTEHQAHLFGILPLLLLLACPLLHVFMHHGGHGGHHHRGETTSPKDDK